MPALRKLRRFWLLAPSERWSTIEAVLLPASITVGFRLLGVPRTQAWVRRWATTGIIRSAPGNAAEEIRMARQAQTRARRAIGIPSPCLVRSLTLWGMLLRRGIAADLRVGFRKRDGKIEGHAWVEHDRVPINEDQSEVETFVIYDQPVHFDLWVS